MLRKYRNRSKKWFYLFFAVSENAKCFFNVSKYEKYIKINEERLVSKRLFKKYQHWKNYIQGKPTKVSLDSMVKFNSFWYMILIFITKPGDARICLEYKYLNFIFSQKKIQLLKWLNFPIWSSLVWEKCCSLKA